MKLGSTKDFQGPKQTKNIRKQPDLIVYTLVLAGNIYRYKTSIFVHLDREVQYGCIDKI